MSNPASNAPIEDWLANLTLSPPPFCPHNYCTDCNERRQSMPPAAESATSSSSSSSVFTPTSGRLTPFYSHSNASNHTLSADPSTAALQLLEAHISNLHRTKAKQLAAPFIADPFAPKLSTIAHEHDVWIERISASARMLSLDLAYFSLNPESIWELLARHRYRGYNSHLVIHADSATGQVKSGIFEGSVWDGRRAGDGSYVQLGVKGNYIEKQVKARELFNGWAKLGAEAMKEMVLIVDMEEVTMLYLP